MSPLENLSDEKLVNLWNQYCDDTNLYPDHIYPNNDETFLMFQLTVRQVLTAQKQGVYDFDHQWLYIDGYANPKSCNISNLVIFSDSDMTYDRPTVMHGDISLIQEQNKVI